VSVESNSTFGAYRVHERINGGGMADIWHVSDAQGKSFALRLMHKSLRFNFFAKKRFFRGCEILSQIHDHDYVISYVEHGKLKGQPFCVMEYVEGDNLKMLYARGDDVLTEFIGNILIDMAISLQHVHDSGFMHLDFKPENVLVTRNGNIRLVDFDLSMPRPTKPMRMGRTPGTPAYMAPEQLQRKYVDHRSDIWAYGVTAYELLTNRKPFNGESGKEILAEQMNRDALLLQPRAVNPDLPANLEKIVMKCLEHEPDNRYQDMTYMVRDLEGALYVA